MGRPIVVGDVQFDGKKGPPRHRKGFEVLVKDGNIHVCHRHVNTLSYMLRIYSRTVGLLGVCSEAYFRTIFGKLTQKCA